MSRVPPLQLPEHEREELWARLAERIEAYLKSVEHLRVAPVLDPADIRHRIAAYDFEQPAPAIRALDFAADALTAHQVHTPHPRYFGLFNPASTTMGIAADALVAAFNCQLAAWSHSPFAVEVEAHLVRSLAARFGYDPRSADGAFTSGGMEANHTALLAALCAGFPDFANQGLRRLPAEPVFYASAESHHSFLKAARLCGLGADSVRRIEVDDALRMRPEALAAAIQRDRRQGCAPFLVVATAGTTNAGAIDPLREIADIAARERIWYHVDAAWGGGAALVPELAPLLDGIAQADSITFDAHKWMSVPMAAGLFLTRHADIMDRTFRIATAYMPRDAAGLEIVDPHLHTMQWSRRFTGLKVFLSLAVAGWEGYEAAIRHQTAMGERLRAGLTADGWEIANRTPLPVICFSMAEKPAEWHLSLSHRLVKDGKAWISTTVLDGRQTVLRACITNFLTETGDVDALIALLADLRAKEI